jgi:hypothetical protein
MKFAVEVSSKTTRVLDTWASGVDAGEAVV